MTKWHRERERRGDIYSLTHTHTHLLKYCNSQIDTSCNHLRRGAIGEEEPTCDGSDYVTSCSYFFFFLSLALFTLVLLPLLAQPLFQVHFRLTHFTRFFSAFHSVCLFLSLFHLPLFFSHTGSKRRRGQGDSKSEIEAPQLGICSSNFYPFLNKNKGPGKQMRA